jgi:hypothetical protein
MGRFIWNDWARFVSISASVYLIWAAGWGIFYRKFFFDFIDHGYDTSGKVPIPIPNPRYDPILEVIVTIPIVQIVALVMGIFTLAFEYPAPFLKGTVLERNFTFKSVYLLFQATVAILFYQGTNAFLWSTIAAIGYARAVMLGEIKTPEKGARGGRGGAPAPRGATRA